MVQIGEKRQEALKAIAELRKPHTRIFNRYDKLDSQLDDKSLSEADRDKIHAKLYKLYNENSDIFDKFWKDSRPHTKILLQIAIDSLKKM